MSALLEAVGVSKTYDATRALQVVDFTVAPGEVHALLGENGAGKSTLVRILSGAEQPDEGLLRWGGTETRLQSPGDAVKRGIAVVHQDLALFPHLTVAENIGIEPAVGTSDNGWRSLGLIDRRALRRRARTDLARFAADLDPDVTVEKLGQAQRQLVAIARALAQNGRLILFDEPTASLLPEERRTLAHHIKRLRDQGLGIVFVTHLLTEAHDLADRITVLRNGKVVANRPRDTVTVDELISLMTGKEAGNIFSHRARQRTEHGTPRLELTKVASPPSVKDVSFAVYPGEIIGVAALVGAGGSETLETIFGLRETATGEIRVDGKPLGGHSPREAIERGIAFVPGDREMGVLGEQSVQSNLIIAASQARRGETVTWRGGQITSTKRLREVATRLIRRLGIVPDNPSLPIRALSGGNQQKVILARWLATRPTIVLADDPTRGVSIGSKMEIYRLLRDHAREGGSVVLVSSEFEELIGLSDRILIVSEGETVGDVIPGEADDLDADALLYLVLAGRGKRSAPVTTSEGTTA